MLLVQLQEAGIQLSKDQLAILADTRERINIGPVAFIVTTNALLQADGVEVYDLDCDDVPSAQPSFMANITSYGSDALVEVHNPETEITSDNNIIPYSQYVTESQQTAINLDNKSVNDSLTAKLEKYKEQVKVLKEVQNVDLKSKDNVLDSCEHSVNIDRLKPILSEHVKEKESLMQTVTLLKNDFKKEEYKNIDREIALEKKIKQLDNIVFKRDQLAQTVHMGKALALDIEKIETINIELDHKVSKLIAENEHLKQTYKQLYDLIKPTRVRSKEQCNALVNQVNQKSVEISDLNASLQEKNLVITALKKELRKLKRKSVIACREPVNKPKVITHVVHKELLVYVSDTCPSSPLKSEKLVVVTPMNIARKVTFAKTSTTSDNNTQIQVDVHQTQTTSKPLVPSTNVKCSTNASRSKPRSETKNNRIMQPLMNDHARAKAVKSIKMKEWKPTGKMFKNVGYKWDLLFQPLFDELLTPPPSVDYPAPKVIAPNAKVVALEPAVLTGSPSSTTVDQDAPSPSNSQTTPETQSPIIPNDVESEYNLMT
ncbi:hypothetical protein Tco_0906953 [Tanacetum coccineum]|uniref:Uncharacterized protein n=1 Tax=Tanacetum coccineum TaxID=301880 RepID=A0ABQ5CIU6_9ASTR